MSDLETPTTPDLAQQVPPIERNHRRRRRRASPTRRLLRRLARIRWATVALALAAIAALAVVGALVIATDASSRIDTAWSSLNRVLDTISSTPGTELTLLDFERLQLSMAELGQALAGADQRTAFLRPLASLNSDLEATFVALEAAQELVAGASDMITGLEPTLFFLASGRTDESVVVQVSSGERIVELLRLGRGRFISANSHLMRAWSYLDSLQLDALSPDLLLTVERMTGYHSQLRGINDILVGAPDLLTVALGLTETQNYLVLAQNSDELRPSGGYVSTFGWMQVRNARIIDYNYSPTTESSPNPPPSDQADQVQVPNWWIRYRQPVYAAWDGSWYADFPSTAAMAAWYYDAGDNPQSPVDGVIAIDLVGFQYILEELGSVVVPGYNEVVTPQNFRQVIYAIRAEGEGDLPHKRFVAALYRQILADWQNVDRERGADLVGATLRALQEKHIMLYFRDERLNQVVNTLGWSGAQAPAVEHDYLQVADANLGSKSNYSIIRQLTYDVEIQPNGSLVSRLTVAYDYPEAVAANDPAVHPAHYNDIDYHNLMQVFAPAGSLLTETNNLRRDPTTVATDTHTAFVAMTEVAYNSGERFQFVYNTPVLVETFGPYRRYRLLLQKQPGMLGEVVSVQVRLPPGAQSVSTSPEVVANYRLEQEILEFRVELVTDQWIEVIYTE